MVQEAVDSASALIRSKTPPHVVPVPTPPRPAQDGPVQPEGGELGRREGLGHVGPVPRRLELVAPDVEWLVPASLGGVSF
jgi:hypothetical protein